MNVWAQHIPLLTSRSQNANRCKIGKFHSFLVSLFGSEDNLWRVILCSRLVILENCSQMWSERVISRHTCAHEISSKVVIDGCITHHCWRLCTNLIADRGRGQMTNVGGGQMWPFGEQAGWTSSNSLEAGNPFVKTAAKLAVSSKLLSQRPCQLFPSRKVSQKYKIPFKFPGIWSNIILSWYERGGGWVHRFLIKSHLFPLVHAHIMTSASNNNKSSCFSCQNALTKNSWTVFS